MNYTPTPHNSAKKGEIAKIVLMAGDPIRVKYIAENFLKNAKLVNEVRGMYAYTGTYNGKQVSVMAHGMGNPSMGIYSYELFAFYDVETIIRVGSIGSLQKDVKIKDIVVAEKVFTNTNYNNFYLKNGENYIYANKDLLNNVVQKASEITKNCHIGSILCSDTYYDEKSEIQKAINLGLLGCEMESSALYLNAEKFNKKAITICTVSNSILTGEETPSNERAYGFSQMVKLALEVAYEL
ncbi:MAG: purine-nucleoside phosphorylase [Clostridiales bacterium]|nr:purine-nucleoside phosphorylase [Clostridiales bacterium]